MGGGEGRSLARSAVRRPTSAKRTSNGAGQLRIDRRLRHVGEPSVGAQRLHSSDTSTIYLCSLYITVLGLPLGYSLSLSLCCARGGNRKRLCRPLSLSAAYRVREPSAGGHLASTTKSSRRLYMSTLDLTLNSTFWRASMPEWQELLDLVPLPGSKKRMIE